MMRAPACMVVGVVMQMCVAMGADALQGVSARDLERSGSDFTRRIGGEIDGFTGLAREIGVNIVQEKIREKVTEKAMDVVEKAKDKIDDKLNITDTYNKINRKIDEGMDWASEKASKIQGNIYKINSEIQRARDMVGAAREVAGVISSALVMPTTNEVLLKIGEVSNDCLDAFDSGASDIQGGMMVASESLRELEEYLNRIRNGVTNTLLTTMVNLEEGFEKKVSGKVDEALAALDNGGVSQEGDGLTEEERAERERDEKEQEEADAARARGEEWTNPETGDTMTRLEREEYEEMMEQQKEADETRENGGEWINPETGGKMTMNEMKEQQKEADQIRNSGGMWRDPETGDTKTALERYNEMYDELDAQGASGSNDFDRNSGYRDSAELRDSIRAAREKAALEAERAKRR